MTCNDVVHAEKEMGSFRLGSSYNLSDSFLQVQLHALLSQLNLAG